MSGYTVQEKYDHLVRALRTAHNGQCDLDALLATEYGRRMESLARLRFRFEEDPGGEECLAFYRDLGVRKELFEEGGFYDRWAMFTPLSMAAGRRYPLIFWNHGGGNPIETDEFSVSITQMAGREGFMVCMLQNTNWDELDRKLAVIGERYPVDPERVYVMGYSQGGQAAQAALVRIPEKLAAVSACGCDAFPLWDNLDVRYTLEEVDRLRDVFVPVLQIAGRYEFLNLLPHNRWQDIKLWDDAGGAINLYRHSDHDLAADPTNPPGKRADKPKPPPHTDADRWKVMKLALRLATLDCGSLDAEQCLAYRDTPEDELHYVLGFAGDREEIRDYYGVRHFIADKVNGEGLTAYRCVGVDNSPHWPHLMLGELSWEFFRQYRRDDGTGRIVLDPYVRP